MQRLGQGKLWHIWLQLFISCRNVNLGFSGLMVLLVCVFMLIYWFKAHTLFTVACSVLAQCKQKQIARLVDIFFNSVVTYCSTVCLQCTKYLGAA